MLLAVDGSAPSDAALKVACSLAKAYGGTLAGAHVLPQHADLRRRNQWLPDVADDERRQALAIAHAAERKAAAYGVMLSVKLVYGDPVTEIVRAADDVHADSIVIGNRGLKALSTLILGSVAAGVMQRGRRPVLVVHEAPGVDVEGCPQDSAGASTGLHKWFTPRAYAAPMFKRIVVPIDGSPLSDSALDLALSIAREAEAEVACCHAVETRAVFDAAPTFGVLADPNRAIDELKNQGEAVLAEARAKAAVAGVPLTTHFVLNEPVSATIKVAEEWAADVIVMGTHGRKGFEHLLLGSIAEGVLRSCSIPVMTVRDGARESHTGWPFERILVAVDDSGPAEAAAAVALAFGERQNTRLIFCTVIAADPPADLSTSYTYDARAFREELQLAAKRLIDPLKIWADEHHIAAETLVVEGDAVTEIQRAAEAARADLVIVGSHGRRGLRRLCMGSVAETLVRSSAVPVLVVRTLPAQVSAETEDAVYTRSLS